jgi:hypothetical protein
MMVLLVEFVSKFYVGRYLTHVQHLPFRLKTSQAVSSCSCWDQFGEQGIDEEDRHPGTSR